MRKKIHKKSKMHEISTKLLIFICITVSLLDYAYCTVAAVHRMPIHKTYKPKNLFTLGQQRLDKEGYNLTLRDYYDIEYVAKISIGTPAQEFFVQLDTGSGLLWVVDSSCGTTGCFLKCQQNGHLFCVKQCDAKCCKFKIGDDDDDDDKTPLSCQNVTKFNSKASTSYRSSNKKFSVEYGFGFAAGSIGQDVIKLGSATEATALTLHGISFGQADQKDTQQAEFSGIFGLTYTGFDKNPNPVIVQAFKQGMFKEPLFSIYLATEGDVQGKPGGVFTLGSVDKENCGEIVDWIDIIPNDLGHWKFNIEQIKLDNDVTIDGEQSFGIVDTGTSFILGPSHLVDKIHDQYGVNPLDGSISCDQKNIGTISFLINGHKYEVTKDTLVIKLANKCRFAISGTKLDIWILGDPFCRKFCQVHDIVKKRVALPEAKKKH